MLISAFGRMVRDGFCDDDDSGDVTVVMDERNMGQSSIALERVFRRMGR